MLVYYSHLNNFRISELISIKISIKFNTGITTPKIPASLSEAGSTQDKEGGPLMTRRQQEIHIAEEH